MERKATRDKKHACLVISPPMTCLAGKLVGLLDVLVPEIHCILYWFPGHRYIFIYGIAASFRRHFIFSM